MWRVLMKKAGTKKGMHTWSVEHSKIWYPRLVFYRMDHPKTLAWVVGWGARSKMREKRNCSNIYVLQACLIPILNRRWFSNKVGTGGNYHLEWNVPRNVSDNWGHILLKKWKKGHWIYLNLTCRHTPVGFIVMQLHWLRWSWYGRVKSKP